MVAEGDCGNSEKGSVNVGRMSKADKEKEYDKLAELLKGTSATRLQDALIKTERVALRMTLTDKTKLEEMANRCGLSATELVTRLIDFAWDKFKGE